MVRKSKNIGKSINGFLIIDSKHVGSDTYYLVKCEKCGIECYKSRTFIKNGGACFSCSGGRNYHNAKGYENTRLYARYMSILRRVKGHEHYKNVEVCKEWVDDYTSFMRWAIENGYDDSLTIDRIDNSKGYSPDNCRWATPKQQANNKRSNIIIEYEGKKFTLSEFAEHVNLPYTTVLNRKNAGWSIEEIAEIPYGMKRSEYYGAIKN